MNNTDQPAAPLSFIAIAHKGCRALCIRKGQAVRLAFYEAGAPRARRSVRLEYLTTSRVMTVSKVEADGATLRCHTGDPTKAVVFGMPRAVRDLIAADRAARGLLSVWTAGGGSAAVNASIADAIQRPERARARSIPLD